jgi:hypothetical protein
MHPQAYGQAYSTYGSNASLSTSGAGPSTASISSVHSERRASPMNAGGAKRSAKHRSRSTTAKSSSCKKMTKDERMKLEADIEQWRLTAYAESLLANSLPDYEDFDNGTWPESAKDIRKENIRITDYSLAGLICPVCGCEEAKSGDRPHSHFWCEYCEYW